MARVCCNHIISNYKRCENDEFIIHSDGSMQCSRCGYYYKNNAEVAKFFFAKEYSRENQAPILEEKIKTGNAKLIATLLPNTYSSFECKELSFKGSRKVFSSDTPMDVPCSWADIYLTDTSTPIVAYYLTFNDSVPTFEDHVITKGDILLIGNTLPKFGPLHGSGSTHRIPVQNPDQLVYTGATVGGITTGGFHTQSGGVHYETVSHNYHQEVKFSAGKLGGSTLQFHFMPGLLYIYELKNIPDRLMRKGQKFDNWDIERMNFYSHQIAPNIADAYSFRSLEDDEFIELVLGTASSDEELYSKACSLMEKNNYESMLKAVQLFDRLGEYKDSLFKKGTCEQKIVGLKESQETNIKKLLWIIFLVFSAIMVIYTIYTIIVR